MVLDASRWAFGSWKKLGIARMVRANIVDGKLVEAGEREKFDWWATSEEIGKEHLPLEKFG